MSFLHEVKYRGVVQVTGWAPSHAQPRPGLIEANACVKQLGLMPKQSTLCVLSASPEAGLRCVDTTFNPPKQILQNSVYEIAHCGVDVSKPKYFTCIVGTKGAADLFFCHVFKCDSKETASKITRAVASACTLAYQDHQKKMKQQSSSASSTPQQRTKSVSRQSRAGSSVSRNKPMGGSVRAPRGGGVIAPRLTDAWFRPSMARGEVNTILRDARVGDFIIRESQTSPGDYALSVQTGNNIWTGLIKDIGNGYQLGDRGGIQFDDITDLVAFYAQNKFMNDNWGYPLTLRMPHDEAPAGGPEPQAHRVPQWREGSGSQRNTPKRTPTFKNPPIFGGAAAGAAPSCGWPASSDEEEEDDEVAQAENFKFVSGRTKRDLTDEIEDEDDAFEKIMNQGMDPHRLDDDKEDIELDLASLGIKGGAKEHRDEPPADNDPFGPEDPLAAAAPAAAAEPPITALTNEIYNSLPQDAEGCLGGQEVRPVLMRSGLPINALGQIWMEVDQERRGKIDKDQLGLILGLISQAQRGEDMSLETLNPDTVPAPNFAAAS